MTRIALFGESEKGSFQKPHFCDTLPELASNLGNPPQNSHGLYFAVQTILYDHTLLYFRVQEEGFSIDHYFQGIELLEKENLLPLIKAICLPGVGNAQIIEAMGRLCLHHRHILILEEKDLYDYLTWAK